MLRQKSKCMVQMAALLLMVSVGVHLSERVFAEVIAGGGEVHVKQPSTMHILSPDPEQVEIQRSGNLVSLENIFQSTLDGLECRAVILEGACKSGHSIEIKGDIKFLDSSQAQGKIRCENGLFRVPLRFSHFEDAKKYFSREGFVHLFQANNGKDFTVLSVYFNLDDTPLSPDPLCDCKTKSFVGLDLAMKTQPMNEVHDLLNQKCATH